MARTLSISMAQAERKWDALWKRLGRMPTVKEYAKALGVGSTRTAFRYKALVADCVTCAACGGRGVLRRNR